MFLESTITTQLKEFNCEARKYENTNEKAPNRPFLFVYEGRRSEGGMGCLTTCWKAYYLIYALLLTVLQSEVG